MPEASSIQFPADSRTGFRRPDVPSLPEVPRRAVKRLLPVLLLLPVITGCAWSARAGAFGTVRDLTELGAEGSAEVSGGLRCGRGLCLGGLRAAGGVFGRGAAGEVAGKFEYLWFFGANAAVVGVSWGPRTVDGDTGHVVSLHLSALEPFPAGSPVGSIGAGLIAGYGFGEEKVRGGWFGVGLFWEFSDIFSWK